MTVKYSVVMHVNISINWMLVAKRPVLIYQIPNKKILTNIKKRTLIGSDRANNDASNHLEKLLRLAEDQTENEYFSDRADK